MEDRIEPRHFSPSDFLRHLAGVGINPHDIGVRRRMVLTYVSDPASLTDWGLAPASVTVWRSPVWYRDDQALGILHGPIGAPAAVMAMEMEEMRALGTEELWILGYAGSLTPRLPLGSVWAVDQAWSDEGTCPRITVAPASPIPIRPCWTALQNVCPTFPTEPCGPPKRSTGKPRQDEAFQQPRRNRGRHGERRAISYWAHLGLAVAAIKVTSDELFRPWRPGFRGAAVATGVEAAHTALLRLLSLKP